MPVAVAVERETGVLPGVRAVPVPGHTPGSLCFVADHLEAAFVGDLVISHGGELTRSLRWANHDDARYLQSIADFAAIAPPAGFPGHGAPVLEGFDAALRALAALPAVPHPAHRARTRRPPRPLRGRLRRSAAPRGKVKQTKRRRGARAPVILTRE
ncbi:hypothetical protein O0235_01540 [Tepidiforma flava]|uniref:MBL fold metallo-hydrolase n=1 Tax=Tepidiforma flava TaxID=3004094 RepID=A0ABY7M9E0_9CHLR|nr:hypothetical protein [Tepidiforma flava]WBL36296.1 hypothetical protein O0235_01540 [Tepidiforma flava]